VNEGIIISPTGHVAHRNAYYAAMPVNSSSIGLIMPYTIASYKALTGLADHWTSQTILTFHISQI